ncbi:hypothetical protein TrST_g7185 [Triparma strigata]|uniref:G-protein coupled receptors family 3 profile domain-containing protein n=1 Tax=Triparma strigata TaxID=1606541 RepID=A0A9W7EEM7_9STRA|nr:hypothetical protein TrST_g7185 [Triparma strigata]
MNVMLAMYQSLAALNGPARSSTTIPLALVGNFGSVPQVGSSQTSPALNDKSLYGNFARTVADDELTADAVVRFFKDTGLDYIGFVYVDDSYGNNFYNFLVSSADKYGLVHIGIPVPSTISKVDAQRIATQMLASGFTSWFNVIFPETYSLLMPEWNSLGMITPSQIFLFGDGLTKNSFSEFDYSLGQGIIQAIGAIPNSPQYNAFVNHWNEQGNATVDEMNTLIQTSALDPNTGMQNAQLFLHDFFQTPPDIDNPFYYDSMAATLLGSVATPFFEPIWRDVVPPGDSIREPPSPPITSKLYQEIISVSFTGATGLVEYSSETGTRKASAMNYGLFNVQASTSGSTDPISLLDVGVSENQAEWKNIDGQCFRYVGGSCAVPPQTNPPATEYAYIGFGLRVLGWVLWGLTLIFCFAIAYWIIRFRKEKILRASQPGFLLMLVAGVAIYTSAIFPYTVDDEWMKVQQGDSAWCMASYWLSVEGFVIIFSALFAKVWRINRIFHNPKLRRIKITAKDVLLPFFIIWFCATLTLVLFTVLPDSPEFWNVELTFDQFGTIIQSSGKCTTQNSSDIYIGVLYGIQILVLVLACWQYYVARKISVEYSESTWISYAVLSVLQVMIISIPLEYMDTGTASKFFINIFRITIVAWSILGFIFVPKIVYLYNDRKEKKGKAFGKKNLSEEEKKNLAIMNKKHRGMPSSVKSTRSSISSSEDGARFVIASTYQDKTGKIEKGKSFAPSRASTKEASKSRVFNAPIRPNVTRRGSPMVGFAGEAPAPSTIAKEIIFEESQEAEEVKAPATPIPSKGVKRVNSYGDGSPF